MFLKFIIFEIMLFFSYVLFRNISKCYKLRVKEKDFNRHLVDIFDLLFYGLVFYLIVFYQKNEQYFDIKYILLYYFCIISFGFLLEIPGVGDTVPNIKKWNLNKILSMILLIFVTIFCSKEAVFFNKINILMTILIGIILLVKFISNYNKNKLKSFHPHHWQVFWFLSLFISPYTVKSKFLSALYLSFFSHGVIAHSAASMFKDD
jgi:hypothetical protein